MQVDDIILPKTVPKQVKELLAQVVEILNNNGYEFKEYTSAPTATDPGFNGELRCVRTGATIKFYTYQNGAWYVSPAAWSQV